MLWLARPLRKRRYRLLAAGPVVLLLSLSPSVLYLDHWSEYLGLVPERVESPLEHIGHCHLSPATCSDQPLPPDLSATPAIVRVAEPELTSVVLEEYETAPEAHVVAPPTDPPRA